MSDRFDYFAVIAGMRTGSNLLEEQINAYDGLTCHGELFNPFFVGQPKREAAFGLDMIERDQDPQRMISAMRAQTEGLPGFRIFDDHNRTALQICLDDPRCAKIVLSRAPLDSYVSLKIARHTGQWWLGDIDTAKPGKARFDAAEFEEFLSDLGAFHHHLRRSLQVTGQTAFILRYEDLGDAGIIAGLARFLGIEDAPGERGRYSRVQNPEPLSEKVENYDEMAKALTIRDPFDLDAHPSFEPPRGPAVRGFIASTEAPLLFLPIEGVGADRVRAWLSKLGGTETGLSRRDLRQWKRDRPGHRTFTVIEHPVARAHRVFCESVLPPTGTDREEVRELLIQRYGLPLPADPRSPDYRLADHRRAFLAFLGFLRVNLAQQTSLWVDPVWASQGMLLSGKAEAVVPDSVMRSESLLGELETLAATLGVPGPDPQDTEAEPGPYPLRDIYDAEIEAAARAAYRRDYITFGYGDFAPG